jgi:hypothetical protein
MIEWTNSVMRSSAIKMMAELECICRENGRIK